MTDLFQDLRFATRQMLKNKTFTFIAVTTLALAVGANTAIFSVVHAVLLASLPYKDVDRIAMIWGRNPSTGDLQFPISPGDFSDWQKNDAFEDIAASYDDEVTLTGRGEPRMVLGYAVTPNYFRILGVAAAMGRTFNSEEAASKAPVAVISDKFWRNVLHADQTILGKTLTLDSTPVTIIGVMPPGFQYPPRTELWKPLSLAGTSADYERRYIRVMGRLKAGISMNEAQLRMNALERGIAKQHANTDAGNETWVQPLRDDLTGDIRQPLLALLAAVGMVLIIACVNIANLFLARAGDRKVELSIRIAMGATRYRLLRQFLCESLMLSFIGGALGLLLAVWSTHFLLAIFPNGVANLSIPKIEQIPINTPVLLFALGVTVLTGVIFGVVTTMQSEKADANQSLKDVRTAGSSLRSSRVRSVLVATEIALSLVLLAGGGLMFESFRQVYRQDLGFHPDSVLAVEVFLPRNRYPSEQPEKRDSFVSNVIAGLQRVPGVSKAAATNFLPLSGFSGDIDFTIEGDARQTDAVKPNADNSLITPGYLSTMGIPMRRGRSFADTDRANGEAVAIVNETFARRFFGKGDPLDRVLDIDDPGHPKRWRIVGIVADVKSFGPEQATHPTLFRPLAQVSFPLLAFVVKTTGNPASLLKACEQAVWDVDKDQPVFDAIPMQTLAAQSMTLRRTSTILLAGFAILAVVVAIVGLYGLMAYSVAQRTREIGIRMALGALQRDVLIHVLRQAMTLVVAGDIVGILIGLLVTSFASGILYGVSPRDPSIFVIVTLILTSVALLASYVPAHRATRVEPVAALRYE